MATRRISQYHPRKTRADRRFDIAACCAIFITAMILGTISWFFLAYTDEIARATRDSRGLIGQLGVISGVGSMLMLVSMPFFIAAIRD